MKLLNESQAVCAYSAMVCLNNVGATIHVRIGNPSGRVIHIKERGDGIIQVWHGDAVGNATGTGYEQYDNQQAFADAYRV